MNVIVKKSGKKVENRRAFVGDIWLDEDGDAMIIVSLDSNVLNNPNKGFYAFLTKDNRVIWASNIDTVDNDWHKVTGELVIKD